MTAASQLDVIKNDDRIFVTVADIAPILKADPLYLRGKRRRRWVSLSALSADA